MFSMVVLGTLKLWALPGRILGRSCDDPGSVVGVSCDGPGMMLGGSSKADFYGGPTMNFFSVFFEYPWNQSMKLFSPATQKVKSPGNQSTV